MVQSNRHISINNAVVFVLVITVEVWKKCSLKWFVLYFIIFFCLTYGFLSTVKFLTVNIYNNSYQGRLYKKSMKSTLKKSKIALV